MLKRKSTWLITILVIVAGYFLISNENHNTSANTLPADQGQLERMLELISSEDLDSMPLTDKDILDIYLPQAEAGEAGAQFLIGYAYSEDRDIPADPEKAIYWYKKAGKNGKGEAYAGIGSFYLGGKGIDKDIDKAIEYFTLGADLNNADCQNALATLYYYGTLTTDDPIKAFKYAKPAAEAGKALSQQILGLIYINGEVVEKNYEEALKWQILSLKQIPDPEVSNIVGSIYFLGYDGFEPDFEQAYKYFKLAADQGNSNAESGLATMYLHGLYVDKNYPKAISLLKKSVNKNNPEGCAILGVVYEEGLGVTVNLEKAKELYIKAKSLGSENVDERLSHLLNTSTDQ